MAQRRAKWPPRRLLLHMSCPSSRRANKPNALSFIFLFFSAVTGHKSTSTSQPVTVSEPYPNHTESSALNWIQIVKARDAASAQAKIRVCPCICVRLLSLSPSVCVCNRSFSTLCVCVFSPFPLYWNLLCCANKILKISYLICISRFLCLEARFLLRFLVHFDAVLMGTSPRMLWPNAVGLCATSIIIRTPCVCSLALSGIGIVCGLCVYRWVISGIVWQLEAGRGRKREKEVYYLVFYENYNGIFIYQLKIIIICLL